MHDLKHYDQFTLDGEILESEEGKHQVWSVGFDTRMSWNKLATHIETQISPHGFINEGVSPDYARRNSEDILEKEAHFYSQALQMSVILFFKSDPAGEGYDAFEGHSLTLVQIMEKTSNDGQDNKTGEVTP